MDVTMIKMLFLRYAALIDQSDNVTVLEGMSAAFFCKFESDLAVFVNWLKADGKNFDPTNSKSFRFVRNESNHEPAVGEVLTIHRVGLRDAGTYVCAGQTNSGMTPGFVHLEVSIK